MKPSVRSILLTAALVMGANGVMASQNSSDWFDQWYKAKYGRNSPSEEARRAASRKEVTPATATPANDWFEHWLKAKIGRGSAIEELRQRIEADDAEFREDAAAAKAVPVNDWRSQFYRAKIGRNASPDKSAQKMQGKL